MDPVILDFVNALKGAADVMAQSAFMGYGGVITPPTNLAVPAASITNILAPGRDALEAQWKAGQLAGLWLEIRVISGSVLRAWSPPESPNTMANTAPAVLNAGDTDGARFHATAAWEGPLVSLQGDGGDAVIAYQIVTVRAGGPLSVQNLRERR